MDFLTLVNCRYHPGLGKFVIGIEVEINVKKSQKNTKQFSHHHQSVCQRTATLVICAVYGQTHDILFNDALTVCMYMPANCSFYINTPAVFLNGRTLSFTVKYKYLGTLMTDDGSDEANISKQRAFFMRAAMVYPKMSMHVRLL